MLALSTRILHRLLERLNSEGPVLGFIKVVGNQCAPCTGQSVQQSGKRRQPQTVSEPRAAVLTVQLDGCRVERVLGDGHQDAIVLAPNHCVEEPGNVEVGERSSQA